MNRLTPIALVLLCVPVLASRWPKQGSGAAALMAKKAALPPVPKAIVLTPRLPTVWHFAATAENADGRSDYSKELVWTNTARVNGIGLAWDAAEQGVFTYAIHYGRAEGVYTNTVQSGTNTRLALQLVYQPTGVVVTVTGPGLSVCLTNPTKPLMLWTGMNLAAAARMF